MKIFTVATAAFVATTAFLAAAAPAYAGTDWTDRKALLAAGCTVRDHPNPTNKIIARPPAISCSPAAKLALADAKRARTAAADQPATPAIGDTAHGE